MDETVLSPAKGDALCCSHRKKARSDQEILSLIHIFIFPGGGDILARFLHEPFRPVRVVLFQFCF